MTTLLLSVHGLLCVSVSQISLSFFLQVDLGPAPIPGGSHLEILDVLTSTETIFQIKVQFIELGCVFWARYTIQLTAVGKARMLIAVSPLSQALPKLTVSRLVLTFISVHVFI